jgi:hypothetical protein
MLLIKNALVSGWTGAKGIYLPVGNQGQFQFLNNRPGSFHAAFWLKIENSAVSMTQIFLCTAKVRMRCQA